jgi:transcriptional regulator with XRE-family HTH domain
MASWHRILSYRAEANKLSADPGIRGTTLESPAVESPARALAAFLRRMRDRAEPGPCRRMPRRRARGLRREEVAIDAGISVTWYTWLEQGRPVRVSRRTLVAIARALHLDATERAHLLRLAEAANTTRPRLTSTASTEVRSLADGFLPHPVYVVNGLWDVLYANRSARLLFGEFDARPGVTDNILRRLYLDDDWRTRFEDWPSVCGSAVAQFRAATARLVGSTAWTSFIDRLSRDSAAFADRWSRHELAASFPREKIVRHPDGGKGRFLYASLAPDAEPGDVRVIVYMPAAADTAAALAVLGTANGAGPKRRAVRGRR